MSRAVQVKWTADLPIIQLTVLIVQNAQWQQASHPAHLITFYCRSSAVGQAGEQGMTKSVGSPKGQFIVQRQSVTWLKLQNFH